MGSVSRLASAGGVFHPPEMICSQVCSSAGGDVPREMVSGTIPNRGRLHWFGFGVVPLLPLALCVLGGL